MRIPTSHPPRSDSAMTPMIDVVFLLLIFFVCTASFEIPEQVLPSSLLLAGGQAVDIEPLDEVDLEQVIIKLRMDEQRVRWIVNERSLDALLAVREILVAIAAIDPNIPVILDVDGGVPLGHAIDVYDVSRLAGFSEVQFAAAVAP